MQRLQFWKKQSRREVDKSRGFNDDTVKEASPERKTSLLTDKRDETSQKKETALKPSDTTPLYEPDYVSIDAPDEPDTNIEHDDSWRRHSTLSFETFKGPQSSGSDPDSSPASHSPDSAKSSSDDSSRRGVPTKVNRNSSFEVIYSQVNKPRLPTPDPFVFDSQSQSSNSPDPKSYNSLDPNSSNFSEPKSSDSPEPKGDINSTAPIALSANSQSSPSSFDPQTMSFDDVLDSFHLSLNDFAPNNDEIVGDISDSNPVNCMTSTMTTETPPEPDIVPSRAHGQCDTPSSSDSHQVDMDLMMSDEIIFRPRKKSVTFNEVIQERPLSIGESITTLDDTNSAKDEDKRPLANGINHHHTNGTIKVQTNGKLPSFPTYDDQDTSRVLNLVESEAANIAKSGNEEVVSVSSFDQFSGEEEDLLARDLPKVNSLRKTRTALLLFTWLCLGITIDLTTCTFPITQQTLNVPIELLARGHVVAGAGSMLAAILVGVVCTCLSRDLLLWVIVGLVAMASAVVTFPWCGTLVTVYTAYAVLGLGQVMIVAATVLLIMSLWDDRKRDVIFHLLFAFQALGSATVPQVTYHVGHIVSNWTIPGLYSDEDLAWPVVHGNGSDAVKKDVGEILREVFHLRIPRLVPVYCMVGALGVLCSLLLCGILGYKNIQIIKRKEHERKAQRLRRQKLKRQIRLVNAMPKKADQNGTVTSDVAFYNNGDEPSKEIEMLLARIREIRQNGTSNTHVDRQLTKLLVYARSQQTKQDKLRQTPTNHKTPTDVTSSKDQQWLQGYQSFGIGTQMYLYVFFTLAGGLTLVYGQFLYLYAHQHMKIRLGYEDVLVLSLYWGSAALARLLVIPVSKILSANALMITCLVTNMSSSAVMIAYADRYPVLLWLFSGLLGASIGPVLPGGFTWANIYYNLKAPKVVSLLFGFWSLGFMLFPWICSFVVDHWGLPAMFYMTIATAGLTFVLYLPILVTLSRRRPINYSNSVVTLPTRTYL